MKTLFASLLGCLAFSISASAAAIPLSFDSCTGFYNVGSETFPCAKAVDGFADDGGAGFNWHFFLGRQGQTDETIQFDAGALFSFDSITLTNTHNRFYNDRGANHVEVWISSSPVVVNNTPGASFGTLVLDDASLNWTANVNEQETYNFAATNGRYVIFRAVDIRGAGSGLAEIEAFGGSATVPEPASLLLLAPAAGVLAYLKRRRLLVTSPVKVNR